MTINHGSIIYVNDEELKTYNSVKTLTFCVMLVSFAGAGLLKVLRQTLAFLDVGRKFPQQPANIFAIIR
jgi:hypothetical protein